MTRRTMPLADHDPNACPTCGEVLGVDGGSWDLDGSYVSQEVSCADCGAEWTDTFALAFRVTSRPDEPSGFSVLNFTRGV